MIEITDSITVLRDGEVVGNVLSQNFIKSNQIHDGRSKVSGAYYREDMKPDYEDEVILTVNDVTVDDGIGKPFV